jgi:outer membrane receptor protein involved in Fe transport
MFLKNKLVRYGWMLLLVGVAPLPAASFAAEEEVTLDEIVVTAQKREESLQDVPLSVAAISGDKLLEAGIQRMDDLKAYVPNFQMTETGIANNIYIRGVGSGLNQGFEQSVSMYADGIYRGRGHQSRMPFLDLARIEVLRGPQPTLFGKNAVAGAVNLVSAKPGDKFEGHVRAWYDTELDEGVGDIVLSGPLSPTMGVRLAVRRRDTKGYLFNLTTPGSEPKRKEDSGRLTLTFKPNERLDAALRIETGTFDNSGRQIEIFGETPGGATSPINGLTYSQAVSGAPLPLLLYPTGLPQGTSASATNNVLDYQRSSNGDTSILKPNEVGLTLNYKLANGLTLTSVTGHTSYSLDELCDCDFVGATVFNAGVTEKYHQSSEELRLTSAADQQLTWIAGVSYQGYKLDESDYLYVPPTSLVMPVLARAFLSQGRCTPATLATCSALASLFSNAANPRVFTQDSKQYSLFAQGTYKVSDAFRITAGGRFSKETKHGSRVTTLTSGVGGPLLVPPAPLAPFLGPLFAGVLGIIPHSEAGSLSESNFAPLLNAQWDFRDGSMAYVSAARGNKAGGFDARSNKPVAAGGTFQFKPEKATTYEIGIKSRIAERAEINANVYYTDYKDLQTSAFDGAIGFNVGNGSAKVKGVEIDGRWQLTPRFRISGSLATLNFEWTNYFGQCAFGQVALTVAQDPLHAGNCNHQGKSNQLAPKMTGVLSADYSWPVGAAMEVRTTVDATYSDKYLLSLNLDQNATQASYTKLNARVSLNGADNHWEVAVVGRNLADKQTLSYAGDTPLSARLFNVRSYYGFVDTPRSLALEAMYRF